MQHLYVLIPNLTKTKVFIQELEKIGVAYENVHVVGQRSLLLQKEHLHEANLIQTSDLVGSLKRGALIGVALSIVLCIAYFYALPKEIKVNLLVIIGILTFGIILGAWVSSLIGISVENPIIEKFKSEVEKGYYIVVFDSQTEAQHDLITRLANQHNEIKCISDH